jgi:hypothetical protein
MLLGRYRLLFPHPAEARQGQVSRPILDLAEAAVSNLELVTDLAVEVDVIERRRIKRGTRLGPSEGTRKGIRLREVIAPPQL